MLKISQHRSLRGSIKRFLFALIILLFAQGMMSFDVIRKSTVTFSSTDGLLITADRYLTDPENPYIILFHQQNSSRGEFMNIARRLCKLDYNCLAVDLRNGGFSNSISNETVKRCQESKCPNDYHDVENDMQAAIQYAGKISGKPVILLGSGANGSLSLMLGKTDENVRAVIALSPGEYFMPKINVHDTIAGLEKPVFITSSVSEIPYVKELASGIDQEYITIFEPQLGEGAHGSKALSPRYENNSEYWLGLMLFFKDLL